MENSDGSISMDVVFSEDVPAPVVKDITEIDNNGYTLNWEAVPNRILYCRADFLQNCFNLIPTIKKQTVDNAIGNKLEVRMADGWSNKSSC